MLIVYVVDAEGKRDARFAPVMDATLKGPDAVFALLRTYLHRLGITQADQVLFIADGAPWIWKRVPLLRQALVFCKKCKHFLLRHTSGDRFCRANRPLPIYIRALQGK